jgi:hypothetical protein
VFYRSAQFPRAFRGDAFVVQGREGRILRIEFESGRAQRAHEFATGFKRDGRKTLGISAMAQSADGSLIVSDPSERRLYRIRYLYPDGN